MQKNLRIDITLFISFLFIIFTYIISELQDLVFLSLIARYCFIVVTIFMFFALLYYDCFKIRKLLLFTPAIIFEILYIINLIGDINTVYFVKILIQGCSFMLVYIIATIKWKMYQFRILSWFSIVMLAIVSLLIFTNGPIGNFEDVNPNLLGMYGFLFMFFPISYHFLRNNKVKFFRFTNLLVIGLIIIYFSFTRSVYLGIFTILITLLLWKVITHNKFLFAMYFVLVITIVFSITVLYPKIYTLDNYAYINNLSLELTGKSIMSGRAVLWDDLLEVIKLKPIFGHGSTATPSDFLNTTLSAHNIYLQTTLQVGIVGVFLLFLFLFFIWMAFWEQRKNKKVMLAASFFIAIIIHQIFVVSLFQVSFELGIVQWIIIGFGLNFCFNKDNNLTQNKSAGL